MRYSSAQTSAFQSYDAGTAAAQADVIAFPRAVSRVALNRRSQEEWVTALEKRFDALTSLPVGWDGYVGKPVSFTCARFAAELLQRLYVPDLPAPSLVPGGDGSLQVEWHINQFDVEIDVLGAFDVIATRHDYLSGETEELELEADVTPLVGWIGDLKADRDALAVGDIPA